MEGMCDQCNKSLVSDRQIEIYELNRKYYSLKEEGTIVPAPLAIPLKAEFCSLKCLRLYVEGLDPDAAT